MNYSFDPDILLYVVGGFLGVAAVAAFSTDTVLALSPVTKSAVFILGMSFFILLGRYFEDRVLESIMYGIAVASFLGLVNYVKTGWSGDDFLVFAASSISIIGLGYVLRERDISFTREDLQMYLGVIAVISVGLMMFDLHGAQPNHSLVLDNTTQPVENHISPGYMVVTNDFLLPREFDTPGYAACIYGPQGRVFTSKIEVDSSAILEGGSITQHDLWIDIPEELELSEELEVKRLEECGPGHTSSVVIVPDSILPR